jgi:hypothetical protein
MNEETLRAFTEMRERFNKQVKVEIEVSKALLDLYKHYIFAEAERMDKPAYKKHLEFLKALPEEELYVRLVKMAFRDSVSMAGMRALDNLIKS